MEALGTLAGGIAHDFNNILTGILGNLQIAQMDLSKGHPSYPALESADHAAHRARALVARILSFSRPRQDNHAPGPLGPTVLEAVELLRAGLPGGMEIDPNCANVDFDSGQIHQAIMNLGTNSAHAISDSGGAISISLRPVKPSQSLMDLHPQVTAAHSVCLSVRDNGSGIRPEVLKRMFEPFFTTKSFGQGTGLGLAMVHTIMTGHKGAIIVESSPGYGTRFDLYFPAAVDPTASAVPAYQTPRPGRLAPFGRNRQIMLVDDEDSVRLVGANLLKRLGFLPSAFARATDALDAFKAKPEDFCIVISDLTMPGMTGVELARHVLAIRTSIPFILTSGHLQVDARQSALQTGIRSVIAKPFEVDDLVRQIQSALGD
jgi:CheY-like chemotaxis protein